MTGGDFMDFMGYRSSRVEEAIKKCLREAKNGKTSAEFDSSEFTADEIRYIKNESKKRLQNGKY